MDANESIFIQKQRNYIMLCSKQQICLCFYSCLPGAFINNVPVDQVDHNIIYNELIIS